MHTMQEPVETIHVYMVREEPKRPYTFLPICAALLCLAVIVGTVACSGSHPAYVHETLRVPAQYLPLQTFKAAQVIVPTGIKTYPATFAVGILTLTNGSIIAQELPNGFIVTANNGVEVVTDSAVFVPAGGADGYGMSTVPAHLLTSGINLSTLAVDQVIGSSLYVRNLSPFT